jgi:hypothetical protein
MASVTADTADDAGRVVLLLRAVVLAVSDLAAVLARLVLIVAERSVQGSKFTQLITLQLVLALGNRRSLGISSVSPYECKERNTNRLNDIVDQLLRLVDLVLCVGHDQTVKVLFLVAGMGSIRAPFALFHGALSTNGNLGAGF